MMESTTGAVGKRSALHLYEAAVLIYSSPQGE
jgi:hypothetical protein